MGAFCSLTGVDFLIYMFREHYEVLLTFSDDLHGYDFDCTHIICIVCKYKFVWCISMQITKQDFLICYFSVIGH